MEFVPRFLTLTEASRVFRINYRKSSTEYQIISKQFNRSENCERIKNVSSVTATSHYSTKSCQLSPGLHVWAYLGCYRLFMCHLRFWSITFVIDVESQYQGILTDIVSSLRWCNLSVSHEARLFWSQNLTRMENNLRLPMINSTSSL